MAETMTRNHEISALGRGFDPGVALRGQQRGCSEASPGGNRKTAAAPGAWHRYG
jgi:hypothetical protein